jgi:hypothetical protein
MRPSDPETNPATIPDEEGAGEFPVRAPGERLSGPSRFAPLLPLAVAVGLGAGFVAGLGGEAVHGFFRPAEVQTTLMGGRVFNGANNTTRITAEIRNAALASGLLGAALGLALGLAGGRARGDRRAALGAALVGLATGTIAGACLSLALGPVYYRNERHIVDDLIWPMLLHGGVWGAVGAAGGLAFGLGLGGGGRAVRASLGGLIGALLGTALFEVIGVVAFPLSRTVQPLATTWGPRVLARLSVAVLAAAGAALAVEDTRERASRPAVKSP